MLVPAHELESVRAAPRHKPRAFLALLGAHSISAGMAAHIPAGAAAMPLHALPYAHRRLALPPVCASRLWPSGGGVARPRTRCAVYHFFGARHFEACARQRLDGTCEQVHAM